MKRGVLIVVVLLLMSTVRAQTWDEWFDQKKTQIKYLLEQVAALKMYGSAVKKGYDVVNGGLSSISLLKESDLRLHGEQFGALSRVKKSVKDNTVFRRIGVLQIGIRQVCHECKTRFLEREEFSAAEKAYFKTVLTNILNQCRTAGEEAILLTSDDQYQLHDNERLQRLQAVCNDLEEQYLFIRHFRNDIVVTAINRAKAENEKKMLQSLY